MIDPYVNVAPSLLADHEPLEHLEHLIRKLQRKLDADAALSGTTLYGIPAVANALVPYGEVWIVRDHDGELHDDGGVEFLKITRVAHYNPRDAAGYPSAVERRQQAAPLYTRHTLGVHEAARDWRRNRRPRGRRR